MPTISLSKTLFAASTFVWPPCILPLDFVKMLLRILFTFILIQSVSLAARASQATGTVLSTAQDFEKTQWVLKHLGIAPEPETQSEAEKLNGLQTKDGLKWNIRYLDPSNTFGRFSEVKTTETGAELFVYQDRDIKKVEDFHVVLSPQLVSGSLLKNLRGTSDHPLLGLRVALDPGHMGGDYWDELTGRAVYELKGKKGRKLSEGMLTLETCLLLKNTLESLGATVFVTHETIGPVTPEKINDLNPATYAPQQIIESRRPRLGPSR